MATPTAPNTPVLSLSTVLERQRIDIDGTLYELRHPDELTWLVYRGHADTYRQAATILTTPERSPEQAAQLDALLPALMRVLVVAPDAVLDRLNNDQRFAIATVFSWLLLPKTGAGAAARQGSRSTTKTGAPSSASSPGSTRARTRGAGSRRSRSGS